MTEEQRKAYLVLGDLDKPFHRPECECQPCEQWRKAHGRPTRAELAGQPPFKPTGKYYFLESCPTCNGRG